MLTERQTRSSYLAWCELFRLLRLKRQTNYHHLSHSRVTQMYSNSDELDYMIWSAHLKATLKHQKVDANSYGPFNPRPLMSKARKAGEDALLWKLSRV